MEKIIEKLKDGIAEAINQQDDLDAASWGYQEGILITANEAKAVLEALKALKISSNPPVIKSLPNIKCSLCDYKTDSQINLLHHHHAYHS